MAQVNPLTREVLVKLVYYGPGLGGKTTSLQKIHAASPPETRGQIVSLATPVDRTLYFDFLPLRAQSVRGNHLRLQLFTVPGQVYFNATRKLVLTGADGVIFVADSQRDRMDANLESLENLASNLEDQDRALSSIPLVLQYNKRDLPTSLPTEEMDEALNALGVPVVATNAARGEGVLEALDTLVRLVLEDLERRNVLGSIRPPAISPKFGRAEPGFAQQVELASQELKLPDEPSTRSTEHTPMVAPPSEPLPRPGRTPTDPTSLVGTDEMEVDFDELRPPSSAPPPEAPRARNAPNTEPGTARPTGAPPAPVSNSAQAADATADHVSAPAAVEPASRADGGGGTPASRVPPRPTVAAALAAGQGRPAAASPSATSDEGERTVLARPAKPAPPPEEITSQSDILRATIAPPSLDGGRAGRVQLSFASLFGEDADEVRTLEAALAEGSYAVVVEHAGALARRLLRQVAAEAEGGEASVPTSVLTVLVGVEPPRYLAFERLVRRAETGSPVRESEALRAYAFLVELRTRADAALG